MTPKCFFLPIGIILLAVIHNILRFLPLPGMENLSLQEIHENALVSEKPFHLFLLFKAFWFTVHSVLPIKHERTLEAEAEDEGEGEFSFSLPLLLQLSQTSTQVLYCSGNVWRWSIETFFANYRWWLVAHLICTFVDAPKVVAPSAFHWLCLPKIFFR